MKSDETYACVTKKQPRSHRLSLPPIFTCGDGITTDGNVANQTRFSPVELWPFTTSAEKTKSLNENKFEKKPAKSNKKQQKALYQRIVLKFSP